MFMLTDDPGNSYQFHERDKGDYVSDSLQFTGQPGHTYRLHIATPDDAVYESDPQRIFPEVSPDNIYAEFDNKEILERSSGLKVNTHGANILTDFHNQTGYSSPVQACFESCYAVFLPGLSNL